MIFNQLSSRYQNLSVKISLVLIFACYNPPHLGKISSLLTDKNFHRIFTFVKEICHNKGISLKKSGGLYFLVIPYIERNSKNLTFHSPKSRHVDSNKVTKNIFIYDMRGSRKYTKIL